MAQDIRDFGHDKDFIEKIVLAIAPRIVDHYYHNPNRNDPDSIVGDYEKFLNMSDKIGSEVATIAFDIATNIFEYGKQRKPAHSFVKED
ncbi:MAG: hypothetical protein M3Q97_09140 [Bacteroidota bacterium]|nr:hypothetical protein [Bacteroidota bacterium]